MWERWLLGRLSLLVACDAPDAGGGGGGGGAEMSAAGADAGAGESSSGGNDQAGADLSAAGGAEPHAAGREEDLEDLLAVDADIVRDPRAVLARNQKLFRQGMKYREIARRFDGQDVNQVLQKVQMLDRITQLSEEAASGNANSRALLERAFKFSGAAQSSTPKPAASPGTRTSGAAGKIDVSKLPFDVNANPVNQFFGQLAQRFNAALDTIDELRGAHTRTEQTRETEQRTARESSWKSALDAAAKQITDADTRTVFEDLVKLQFQRNQARDPQQIIKHYLTKLRVDAGTQQRATDAARARQANKTVNLQRQHTGAGSPASAHGNQRKTFESIRQSILES